MVSLHIAAAGKSPSEQREKWLLPHKQSARMDMQPQSARGWTGRVSLTMRSTTAVDFVSMAR
jgi:hypothetical protein